MSVSFFDIWTFKGNENEKVLLGLAVLLTASLSVRVEAAYKKAVVATAGDIKLFLIRIGKGS